ncbi:unnamed protein product, partial [Dibothriocephalus latus]
MTPHFCISFSFLYSPQPTVTSSTGVQNNTITVNLSDFDVIETLTNMDAVPTGSSPPGEYGQIIPPNPTTQTATSGLSSGASSTGAAGQPAPTTLGIDAKSSKPPLLPPQLLQARAANFGVAAEIAAAPEFRTRA